MMPGSRTAGDRSFTRQEMDGKKAFGECKKAAVIKKSLRKS
jgi:hypothetical protein